MKNNLIKYKRNIKRVYERAGKKSEEGDYVTALSLLLHEEATDKNNAEVCVRIAHIYTELGLYENAIIFWFKYLARVNKKQRYIGYNGLGANFSFIGDKEMAGHYFNMQLTDNEDDPCYYEDVLEEFFDEMLEYKSCLRLIKDKTQEEIDAEIIQKAENHYLKREYEIALSELNKIGKDSPLYGQSLYEKCLNYIAFDDLDSAKECIQESIKNGYENSKSLSVIAYFFPVLSEEEKEYWKNRAVNLKCCDDEEKYKKINLLLEFKIFDKAEELCDELLKVDRYDVNCAYIKGFFCYNRGDYSSAVKNFKKAYFLSFSPIALYYLQISEKAKAGSVSHSNLLVEFNLPLWVSEEIEKIVDLIAIYPSKLKEYSHDEILQIFDYAVIKSITSMQMILIYAFVKSKDDIYINAVKEFLVNPTTSDLVKSSCLSKLYEYTNESKFCCVFKNYFKELKIRKVEFKEPNQAVFHKAYAYAVGRLAPFEKDGFHKLEIGAKELQNELIATNRVELVTDIPSLALAMYFYSGKRGLPSEFLYMLFDTRKDDVVKIIKYTEESDD